MACVVAFFFAVKITLKYLVVWLVYVSQVWLFLLGVHFSGGDLLLIEKYPQKS